MRIVNRIQTGVDGVLARIYTGISTAPTTNMRILMTLGITLGTAIKYWASATWVPHWEWLIFLAGMAGIDVWQHINKRKTNWHPATLENGHGDKKVSEEIG